VLQPCIERPEAYLALVVWQTVECREARFRQSAQYQPWKPLLNHFYVPVVSHYRAVPGAV